MIESPVLQDLVAKVEARATARARQQDILKVLQVRFETVPEAVATAVQAVTEEQRLDDLVAFAASCPDLAAFQQRLPA